VKEKGFMLFFIEFVLLRLLINKNCSVWDNWMKPGPSLFLETWRRVLMCGHYGKVLFYQM